MWRVHAAVAFRKRVIKPSPLRRTERSAASSSLLALANLSDAASISARDRVSQSSFHRSSSSWRGVFSASVAASTVEDMRLTLKMMNVNPSSVWYEATWTRASADSTSTALLPFLPRLMMSFILPSSGASCARSVSNNGPSFRPKALQSAPRASRALSSPLAWKWWWPSLLFLSWNSASS